MKTKKSYLYVLAVILTIALCACSISTSMSYSFDVQTGDTIKVSLDTSDGMSLTQKDGRFAVIEDEETVLVGIFLHEEGYQSYLAIKGEQGMTVLEDTQKDGNTYYMYEIEGESGTEDNFVMRVQESKTGVLLASLSGREKAKKAFEKLTIVCE